MGLDMYLERDHYIGGHYDHRNVSGMVEIKMNDEILNLDPKKISSIEEHVGYWRKANQIHNFFVERAQDGRDECHRSYVPNDLLIELRDICKEILSAKQEYGAENTIVKSLIQEKLPPVSGFFFGSTEVDEYYFQDLEDTIDILKDVKPDEGDYYYQSSW